MPNPGKTASRSRTQIRGWHLRNYKEMSHSRGVTYSATIWRNGTMAGDGYNSGDGGADRVHIAPAHREAWEELNTYVSSQPSFRAAGSPLKPQTESELFQILCDLFQGDAHLRSQSREKRAALLGYRFYEQNGFIHATPSIFLYDPRITPTPPPEFVRYVFAGKDNPELQRFVSAPETAPPLTVNP